MIIKSKENNDYWRYDSHATRYILSKLCTSKIQLDIAPFYLYQELDRTFYGGAFFEGRRIPELSSTPIYNNKCIKVSSHIFVIFSAVHDQKMKILVAADSCHCPEGNILM